MNKVFTLLFLLIVFICNNSYSASFDCDQNLSNIETIICNNDQLSKLDEKMHKSYSQAMNHVIDLEYLKNNQLSWLKKRNQSTNIFLLKKAYSERITFLNSFDSQKVKPLKLISKYNTMTWGLKLTENNGRYIFMEMGRPSYKITEFNPKGFSFSTLFESEKEISYVAHNNRYIVINDHNFSAKTPLIVIDRKTGKEIARKGLRNSFVWGEIENDLLIGIQSKEAIIFDLKSLDIKKIKKLFHRKYYRVLKVVKKDNSIIIQTPYSIEIYDKEFNRIRAIELPKRIARNNAIYSPGEMIIHANMAIISINGETVNIYNLENGQYLKSFKSPAKFVSYSISNKKIWIFPIEASNNEKAHVYDFDKKILLYKINMLSGTQIWNNDEMVSIEKNFSSPTIFTRLRLD